MKDRFARLIHLEKNKVNIYMEASAQRLMRFIEQSRFTLYVQWEVQGIEEKHVVIKNNGNSTEKLVDGDKVILALGYTSDRSLRKSLRVLGGGVTKEGESNHTGVFSCALSRTLKGGKRLVSLHTDIEDSKDLVNDVAKSVILRATRAQKLETLSLCEKALETRNDQYTCPQKPVPLKLMTYEEEMYRDRSVMTLGYRPKADAVRCWKTSARKLKVIKRSKPDEGDDLCLSPPCSVDFYTSSLEPQRYPGLILSLRQLQQAGKVSQTAKIVLKWDLSVDQVYWESLKQLAESATEFNETEFDVTLDRRLETPTGLKLQSLKSSLAITDVNGGAAQTWNERNSNKALQKGDCILKANEKSGSAAVLMDKYLKWKSGSAAVLQLRVVRPVSSCEEREVCGGLPQRYGMATFQPYVLNMSTVQDLQALQQPVNTTTLSS